MNSINKKWKPDVERAWQTFYAHAHAEGLIRIEESQQTVEEQIRRAPSWYMRWSVAAILCALCTGITCTLLFGPRPFSLEMITLQNNREGEVLVATLPDGSVALLSQGGKLTYPSSFEGDKRRVLLKGEAFFDVTPNPKNVFIIETELITVEVVGTSFRIKAQSDIPFELAVKSGVVKAALKNEEREVYVEEGEKVQLVSNWLQKSYIEDDDVLGGNFIKLYFKDESLEQIIHVVNECTSGHKQLALEDESLKARVITVTLNIENSEGVAEILCNALNLKQTIGEEVILIGKK